MTLIFIIEPIKKVDMRKFGIVLVLAFLSSCASTKIQKNRCCETEEIIANHKTCHIEGCEIQSIHHHLVFK